uniref:MKRN2 opposite strand protein-like C-terminal domain-containing protein n=1 Tax=Eptatretus burgeri TaxID=7764 RepID=A0A8C4R3C1_EPTBU
MNRFALSRGSVCICEHPWVTPLIPLYCSGYKTDDDLHVGITSSNGEVFSFGPDGVGRDGDGWGQCLVVPLLGASALAVRHAWDAWLDTFSEIPAWQSLRYDEHHHNCLDFALDFWNSVLAREQHPPLSKLDFTALYVLPVLRRASRYLFLLEGATQHGCHLVNTACAAYSTDSLASMMLS